MTKNNAIAG